MRIDLAGPTGAQVQAEADSLNQTLVAPGDAPYAAAVERGNVFMCAAQATVTTQAGLSATTPAMTVANRPSSGKVVKLWYAGVSSLVSPTAAAACWLAYGVVSATAVTETTPTVTCINAKTGIVALPTGVGVAVVATLPAAPLGVAILGSQASSAVTLTEKNFYASRWFGGALYVPAGANISVQTSTATTIFTEFIFEVVDA